LLQTALPHTYALHLKNTDQYYEATLGFTEEERERGIIQIAAVRELVLAHADQIPVDTLVGYLEVSGPKLGRDYSDHKLEKQLRESFRYLKGVWDTKI
ncbi:MAG: hypothetical protein NZ765_13340, partial [Anaerolineae bacterium]|nr:hypothetical protein [Anaerolineae bacterium]